MSREHEFQLIWTLVLLLFCLSGEHHNQEIGEEGVEEEELTEEEWSRRVAELKAFRVAISVIHYSP